MHITNSQCSYPWVCFATISSHELEKETILLIVVVAQSFSRVWLFATPWAAACQVSLSSPLFRASANSYPSNHLILCHPFSSCLQSFPASRSFLMSLFFVSGDQSFGGLASSSVLPMNIQNQFPLGLTCWSSLQSKGLSKAFSNTTVKIINSLGLSLLYGPTLTSIHDYWRNHSFD